MKYAAVCAMVGIGLCLGGCIGQETINARAYGPTEAEARDHAKGLLDEQAQGRKVMSNVGYHTKELKQPDGGVVYEVSAAERVKG